MEKKKTLELIELYRNKECLWDPKCERFKILNAAWKVISAVVNCDTIEVKKKVNSILASFRRERQKESMAKASWSGADALHGSHLKV
nr:unnamed protein product [Callosobruchus chinensis]